MRVTLSGIKARYFYALVISSHQKSKHKYIQLLQSRIQLKQVTMVRTTSVVLFFGLLACGTARLAGRLLAGDALFGNVAPPEGNEEETRRRHNDTTEDRHDNFDERGPYYGGDMILNEDQLAELKQGIIGSTYRWPGGRIPYVLDSTFTSTEQTTIQNGMNLITSATCITFYPRGSEAQYVYIQRGASGTGCYSDVGRQTSKYNVVNLQYNGCVTTGITAHELIHAIGYYHEQSRPDRDNYVSINWSNIQSGRSYNFDKYTTAQVTSPVAYDYDSIMHYSAYAFAINTNTPTLTPTQSVALSRLGQRSALSSLDAQKINAIYSGIC